MVGHYAEVSEELTLGLTNTCSKRKWPFGFTVQHHLRSLVLWLAHLIGAVDWCALPDAQSQRKPACALMSE